MSLPSRCTLTCCSICLSLPAERHVFVSSVGPRLAGALPLSSHRLRPRLLPQASCRRKGLSLLILPCRTSLCAPPSALFLPRPRLRSGCCASCSFLQQIVMRLSLFSPPLPSPPLLSPLRPASNHPLAFLSQINPCPRNRSAHARSSCKRSSASSQSSSCTSWYPAPRMRASPPTRVRFSPPFVFLPSRGRPAPPAPSCRGE